MMTKKDDPPPTSPSPVRSPAAKISSLADTFGAGDGERIPAVLARGTSVGRYLVLGELGAGGMGVVHEAYDPKLDRRVALKALHERVDDRRDTAGKARLVQEAQAMARLSHPNVVTVYDVLVDGDRALVAMELVEGESLRGWLGSKARGWREILAVFVQAGQGLAAAHEAGIVHGDFKADNVLVGKDGRVRVGDFGLARASSSLVSPPTAPQPTAVRAARLENIGMASTVSGELVGTPAYMAPEQLRGATTDERSDQFAFSVALYEALYGASPFEGESVFELVDSIQRQRFRPTPPKSPVPRWIRAVVSRGLRLRPDDRFPSIRALIAALDDDPSKPRKRLVIGVGVIVAAAIGAAAYAHGRRVEALECRAVGERVDTAWNDEKRRAVHDAFVATTRPYAEDAFARTAHVVDTYASGWSHQAAAACARGAHATKDPLAAERAGCMAQRLTELRAFVDVLGRADGATLDRAVAGARALVAIDVCEGPDPLRGTTWPSDPTVRDQAQALTEQLAAAKALLTAGRFREGLSLATKNAAEAERIGFQPLLAEAIIELAALQRIAGAELESETSYKRAVLAAERTGSARIAARGWASLAGRAEERQATDLALERFEHADAWAERVGDDPLFHAKLWLDRGIILSDAGRYDESRALVQRALVVLERADDDEKVEAWNALGIDADMQGRYEEARASYQRVIDWRIKVFGPDHPEVAVGLANLGEMASDQGQHDEALADLTRALVIDERAFGVAHPAWLATASGLARAYVMAGRPDQGLPLAREAASGARAAFGAGSKVEGDALSTQSRALLGLHRPADAIEPAERDVVLRSAGPDDADLAGAKANLGLALLQSRHDPKRGRELLHGARDALAAAGKADRVNEIDAALAAKD